VSELSHRVASLSANIEIVSRGTLLKHCSASNVPSAMIFFSVSLDHHRLSKMNWISMKPKQKLMRHPRMMRMKRKAGRPFI
jgi:hypothetical protein